MGKKSKSSSNLGRSLIRDRFHANKGKKHVSSNSMLHTAELPDGYDWSCLNLQSVTEQSSFQDFLATAELAGTEFQAEKLNIKFINPQSNVGLLTEEELKKAKKSHQELKDFLKIPRRPQWNSETTPKTLDLNEKLYFLEWRRNLAKFQDENDILLTPYERNLEFWRQLWRVVERSDVIVQIVDARNPLLFRCEDLEEYVKEVSKEKLNVILINKSDYLNEKQRQYWAEYFTSIQVQIVFFSAVTPTIETINEVENTNKSSDNDNSNLKELKENVEKLESSLNETEEKLNEITNKIQQLTPIKSLTRINNSSKLLTRDELIEFFSDLHKGVKVTENLTTIGLVGYPNVGKSSTINNLLTVKKVSVSATPGKTKHFQTLFLNKTLLLCDCPGLVMPSFVYTKAEMLINGILPIDQMRDHVPPINLLTSLIPRHVIEDKYGIMIALPNEKEDANRNPTSEELLNAYAYNRGFMTANGQPDNARAARYVLKDFINGKLLYCHAPPGIDQTIYHQWLERQRIHSTNRVLPPRQERAIKSTHATTEDVNKIFFQQKSIQVRTKGVAGKSGGIPQNLNNGEIYLGDKPWKQINKHANKNKKEKLRRVYAHLDQH